MPWQGFRAAARPKGFPVALWKPSGPPLFQGFMPWQGFRACGAPRHPFAQCPSASFPSFAEVSVGADSSGTRYNTPKEPSRIRLNS